MIDGFELYLTNGLKNATAKLQEARHRVMELERDSNYFEKHLAIHLQMKEDEDPPTQAFPAVPVENGFDLTGLLDQRVTVAYRRGGSDTGRLTEVGAESIIVDMDGYDGGISVLLSAVASVVPAPPADPAVTITDPQDATPKDGADHAER